MLSSWRHSGFNVFCGKRISPKDDTAMENLARYIIRPSFSQERMTYLDQEGKVIYKAKDGKSSKSFPALEWMAAMCSHIPNRGEQMVRYYGRYSNVSRGKRQKNGDNDSIPCILEPEVDIRILRRNWARLIQKIYEVDPLICPKCKGEMHIISSIEDPAVIRAILEHLGLWLARACLQRRRGSRPPPKSHDPPACPQDTDPHSSPYITDEHDQPFPSDEVLCRDPEYSWDEYIQ
jgi:hypothetical protein